MSDILSSCGGAPDQVTWAKTA